MKLIFYILLMLMAGISLLYGVKLYTSKEAKKVYLGLFLLAITVILVSVSYLLASNQ